MAGGNQSPGFSHLDFDVVWAAGCLLVTL